MHKFSGGLTVPPTLEDLQVHHTREQIDPEHPLRLILFLPCALSLGKQCVAKGGLDIVTINPKP